MKKKISDVLLKIGVSILIVFLLTAVVVGAL